MSDTPAKKFEIGLLSVAIWKNTSNDRTFYTVELKRSYKNGDGYKSTSQLNHSDLMNGARLLAKAESWIAEQ